VVLVTDLKGKACQIIGNRELFTYGFGSQGTANDKHIFSVFKYNLCWSCNILCTTGDIVTVFMSLMTVMPS
jgi:hypothetical protein